MPDELRQEWASRAHDGLVSIGLQDAYRLLRALNDTLGEQFFQNGLAGDSSPMSARNRSILAHGFDPIGDKMYGDLRSVLGTLGGFWAESESWLLPTAR
ncbi:MAG: hypothetical protein JXQ75_01645 [Phycisphaerae bacterium]|nr:hypothetical protein [Phycisphaerae bacterium]